ncbi:hypothetical protein RW1_022_00640 [Rhodococcus wratislaviensis NBRC 100605]|uniref:Uncharacterized protein n=1 Tax=Rhodococcus wratislaviensis NBRC 100605 TaxID=1219028 RepID=X0Q379_RHOWR|nr:hypothetical protein RW1_022_00640 [Rhodococcus wratislaviensis NBRC 100605]
MRHAPMRAMGSVSEMTDIFSPSPAVFHVDDETIQGWILRGGQVTFTEIHDAYAAADATATSWCQN